VAGPHLDIPRALHAEPRRPDAVLKPGLSRREGPSIEGLAAVQVKDLHRGIVVCKHRKSARLPRRGGTIKHPAPTAPRGCRHRRVAIVAPRLYSDLASGYDTIVSITQECRGSPVCTGTHGVCGTQGAAGVEKLHHAILDGKNEKAL